MVRFEFREQTGWPPLAWLASSNAGAEWTIRHGSRVETHGDWFGEIVWNGPFDQGAFNETDIVFGSGARIVNDGSIVFVASCNTLDRLVSFQDADQFIVSNSIACLAAHLNASFLPWYPGYPADFKSIIRGPDNYVREIASSVGPIRLTYIRNLEFDGTRLVEIEKPKFERHRSTFERYKTFLLKSLGDCCSNMRSSRRKHSLKLLGTLSSGFDSTTAAALGSHHGLKEAFTITSSRGGQTDSGAEIGKCLGLKVHEISRDAWQAFPLAETTFLAGDAKGEDVYFRGADSILSGKVVLTGFSGSIWGGHSSDYIKGIRTDQSGLSLTEYRLHSGAINMPVPSIGVFGATDLLDLMSSDDARKWSSGQSYDKPFCRMILQGAGVPDGLYGIQKRAASVLIEDRSSFLSDQSRQDFEAYLGRIFEASPGKAMNYRIGRIPKKLGRKFLGLAQSMSGTIGSVTGTRFLKRLGNSVRLSEFASSELAYRFLFPWAIEHAQSRYRD